MSSLFAVALLIAALAVVVGGAELFFESLLRTAAIQRVSPWALAILVSGLELENLVAGIAANAHGLGGAAAGTFLGGTTFLALGVAGIAAVLAPITVELPRSTLGWTAASPLPLTALALDGRLSRIDGLILIVWFAVAILWLARAGRALPAADTKHGEARPGYRAWSRLLAGLAILTVGGAMLGAGIRRVVTQLGLSQTLLGNTVVAASVEAEEAARVAVPARRGRGDLALANIAGTIVHFVALNAGVIALVRPLRLDAITLHLHLPVAVASTIVFCLIARGRRLARREGLLLCGLYTIYIGAAIASGV